MTKKIKCNFCGDEIAIGQNNSLHVWDDTYLVTCYSSYGGCNKQDYYQVQDDPAGRTPGYMEKAKRLIE